MPLLPRREPSRKWVSDIRAITNIVTYVTIIGNLLADEVLPVLSQQVDTLTGRAPPSVTVSSPALIQRMITRSQTVNKV